MKYGESIFEILYLIAVIAAGILIIRRRSDVVGRLMGGAALILGAGDAFHLIPRVLSSFSEADLTFWLGFGKLVTSITITVFYVLLFLLHRQLFTTKSGGSTALFVFALAILRVIVCLLPFNGWFENKTPFLMSILRNAPFVALGALVVLQFWLTRRQYKELGRVWLYITLSFLFYIPVAVFAGFVPQLGVLMLPKTVCYLLIIGSFLRFIYRKPQPRG